MKFIWFYRTRLVKKSELVVLLLLFVSWGASGQTDIKTQSVYSAGTTTGPATNGSNNLYSSIGQPIVWQATPPAPNSTTTNAGFMQVVNYIIADTQAPIIQLAGTPTLVKGSTNSIAVTVTDVGGSVDPTMVTLHYRNISGKNFLTAPMIGTAPNFSATINAAWPDAMGLEYFITAKDVAGNEGRHPSLVATEFNQVFLKDPAVSLPPALLSYGSSVLNYRVLSLPYDLADKRVSQIFTELGGSDKSNYRIWQYNSASWKEFPSDFTTLNRAEAFFMIIAGKFSDKNLSLGEQIAPDNHRSKLFEIPLKPGWNLVGNPYTVPINWPDVKSFPLNAAAALGDLKLYTGSTTNSGYANATDVAAFQGGFVFLDGTVNQTISIPFKGQDASGGRIGETITANIDEDYWRVDLNVNRGQLSNTLAGFGMHPEARINKDRFDDHNPPHFDQFVEINFPHPEHSLKTFSRDVVTTQDEYAWSFNVDADETHQATLSWDNADFESSTKELFLYDEENNKVVDMRTESLYTFNNAKSSAFKIYFGRNVQSKIKPAKVFVSEPYPNPVQSGNSFAVDLALPESSGLYQVSIDLINSQSQKMGSYQKQIQAGRTTSVLDLTKNELSSGIYFYRLIVSSSTIQQVVNGKLIVQ
jgi:hypothetical protein